MRMKWEKMRIRIIKKRTGWGWNEKKWEWE